MGFPSLLATLATEANGNPLYDWDGLMTHNAKYRTKGESLLRLGGFEHQDPKVIKYRTNYFAVLHVKLTFNLFEVSNAQTWLKRW